MSNIETLITLLMQTPSRNRNRHPLCYLMAYQISRYEALLPLFKPLRFEKLYGKILIYYSAHPRHSLNMPFVRLRGDNKELVELSLLYLGDTSVPFKSFKKHGALHKARWMSKILYSIKIVLLSPHITKAVTVTVCNKQCSV